MARKKSADSKSGQIRKYLARRPKAGPKQVVAAFKEKGIEVTESLVAAVKYRGNGSTKKKAAAKKVARKKARPTKTARKKVGRKAAAANGELSAADLIEAKKLVDRLGGVEQARAALETLEQLR